MGPHHTCSYYCTPGAGIHAFEVLVNHETSHPRLTAHMQYVYGSRFVRLAPAREADVATWHVRPGWIVPLNEFHDTAYLCWLSEEGPGVPDAEAYRRGMLFEIYFPMPSVPTEAAMRACGPWLQEEACA